MAVEARHINNNLFPPQLLYERDYTNLNGINSGFCNTHMDFASPLALANTTLMPDSFLPPFSQYSGASAKTSTHNYKADSGITYNISATPRKRPRSDFVTLPQINDIDNNISGESSVFDQGIMFRIAQHQSEIDRLIAHHNENVRLQLQQKRVRQSRMLVAAIQETMMAKLKEKDVEIQRMGKINWALQERVKSLCVENQLWRDLAQTNEATANSLRNNLEQVLAHVAEGRPTPAPAAGDAESSCGSNGKVGNDEDDDTAAGTGGEGKSMCKKCGVRESVVLLLPCRHLCLCAVCGSALTTCPVCLSGMNASVHINLS